MRKLLRNLVLYGGDITILVVSLFLALSLRFGETALFSLFSLNLVAFLPVFVVWIIVFYVAGLYNKYDGFGIELLIRKVGYSFIANAVVAVFYFYLITSSVTPKTILLLLIIISCLLIFFWRFSISKFAPRSKREALIIAGGEDARTLHTKISNMSHSPLGATALCDTDGMSLEEVTSRLQQALDNGVMRVVIQSHSALAAPLTAVIVDHLSRGVQLFDFDDVYEDVLGKVSLSSLSESWLIKNISHYHSFAVYDVLKRMMDIIIAVPLFIISIPFYPVVALLIYIQDKGPTFVRQERIGKYGTIISLLKFRSMKVSDGGVWVTENDDRITRVGKIIRNTRIDELPQLLNVIRGDLSLIGPRPDIVDLGNKLKQEIPFYTVRTIIKPGLSGWAQIQQELPPQSVEETRERLAFDCYYIKHRSFILDLSIALSTVRILLSRTGK